jgi:hypothetical protein
LDSSSAKFHRLCLRLPSLGLFGETGFHSARLKGRQDQFLARRRAQLMVGPNGAHDAGAGMRMGAQKDVANLMCHDAA